MKDPAEKMVEDVLKRDPLQEVEDATGKPYQESLGLLALHHVHEVAEEKEVALRLTADTYYRIEFRDFVAILEKAKFEKVYETTFKVKGHYAEDPEEEGTQQIWFREDGLLLVADDYWKHRSLNGGQIYFNWRPHDQKEGFKNLARVSGGFRETKDGLVFVGHYDVREGMIHTLKKMERGGKLLNPWIQEDKPHLWFAHWGDSRFAPQWNEPGYEGFWDKINADKLAQLPKRVRACIGDIK